MIGAILQLLGLILLWFLLFLGIAFAVDKVGVYGNPAKVMGIIALVAAAITTAVWWMA